MKTKHLFLATALMASFAACTNEEIVSDVQQNVATGRPTVDNVKLTFGENVDSRLVYEGKWKWEATDKIGALLMDNVKPSWNHEMDADWSDKYALTPHIHTSYPFSYNAEEGTWGTPGKMLEGNYFFAFPWESYEGQRMVSHSLINQKQTGITADVRAKSYADNQFFIGYDRIIAGTQDAEALNNVSMTSILGAIELRITNVGTQAYNINKVVVSGAALASQLTFDPVLGYTYLSDDDFNSANYLDLDGETEWKLDLSAYKEYDKDEALRAVVKPLEDENNDNFAQIIIEGEERTLLPNAKNTAYVLIMANPTTDISDLTLSIYTDEGMVSGIELDKVNNSEANLTLYGYKTDAKIKEIHPETKNVIGVTLDDNAFEVPETMTVYNTQDLEQLIEWNATISGIREVKVNLAKDVTLTDKAYAALVAKKNMTLQVDNITSGDNVLTLAEELPIDIFENENLDINTDVKALCDIELTEECENMPASIEVAKNAELTIDDAFASICDITNYGTLTIGKNANVKAGDFVNYGEMTVAKEGILTKNNTVVNEGKLDINGYVKAITTNGAENEEAEITIGAYGDATVTTNSGIITSEGVLSVTTNGADAVINYEGGDLTVTTKGGEIRAEISGTIDEDALEDLGAINTWIVKEDVTFDDDEYNFAFATILVKDGADVIVEEGTSVEVEKMIIEGKSTIEGEIAIKEVEVEENAKLTIDEEAVITAETKVKNEGIVVNNGTVKTPSVTGEGDWRGNDNVALDVNTTDLNNALTEAVAEAIEEWMTRDAANADSPSALGYNLKATGLTGLPNNATSGATLFAVWIANNTNPTYDANGKVRAAIAALTAYNNVATTDKTISSNYSAAVTRVLALYKGTESKNATTEKVDKFTPLTKALTWAAPATLAEGMARIYKDKKEMNTAGTALVDVTAATLAKRDFQAAIKNATSNPINKGGISLTQTERCMIITNGENVAPAGSQVFVTDNIYKVFNKTNGIGQLTDWTGVIGSMCNTVFATESDLTSSGWTAAIVKNWVEKVAVYQVVSGTPEVIEASKAKAFVTANTYEIYEEAKTWDCYSPNVVMAIVADYNGWTLANGTVQLP